MNLLKKLLKTLLPQQFINSFYHLPKAFLANIYYGLPSRKLTVVGITGTDGKSTTTNMIFQILKAANKKVSMVSTVNAVIAGRIFDTGFHVTSPDPFTVQRFAKLAKENGDEYLVLEVTSHALDQYRFWGINFKVGVITNITHEHLDYHGKWESYFMTKVGLIRSVKFAIINQNLKQLITKSYDLVKGKVITFGLDKGDFNQKNIGLKLKIPGNYNIENALAALAVAFVLNIDKSIAQKALENFQGLKGRMEKVKNQRGIRIFIDFAHTPNGLKQALKTLSTRTKSERLITLIGAEGFRDEKKRAMMGEIASKLSDTVIVTAVDPRGQLDTINRQITEGAKRGGAILGQNYFIINDRQKAIDFAINNLAKRGDCIGIFGKGHELSMNLDGKKEVPWSDIEAVDKALL